MVLSNASGVTKSIFKIGKTGKAILVNTNYFDISADGTTSNLTGINASNFYQKGTALFNTAGSAIHALDADTATNATTADYADNGVTQNQVNEWNSKADGGTVLDYTLLVTSWIGVAAPYIYTITPVPAMTFDAKTVIEIIPSLTITNIQLEAYQGLNMQDGGVATNSFSLKAYGTLPTIDIPIRAIIWNSYI